MIWNRLTNHDVRIRGFGGICDDLATEQRTNAEQFETWNNVIQRGATYLNRLKQREKELAV